MVWFKVDDGFPTSKAVLRIPRKQRCQAVGLWTLAGTWSSKELTDGFIPEYILDDLGATKATAAKLVMAGLWEIVEEGWQFVGWDRYNPTRAQVLEEREREAERKRKWREAKRNAQSKRSPQVDADASDECPTGTPPSVPGSSQAESALPDPTRPDPSRPLPKGSSEGEARKRAPARDRGHRLPENWEPPADVIRQMRDECPNVDLRAEHLKFTDHWNDQPGAKGRKVDWVGTWRNWMRREAKDQRPGRGHQQQMTPRESEFLKAELLKDNPSPEALRMAGIQSTGHLIALPGGL
ncbi:hypothetical protein [Nocardia sp. NPDC003963]